MRKRTIILIIILVVIMMVGGFLMYEANQCISASGTNTGLVCKIAKLTG